ncbi:MAG: helix-turn-helix transcriptional regulator [Longimicrobiales bacterium]
MPDNISKVQRWLDLIAYLVGRHFPVPVEELMERLPAYARDWKGGGETARDSVRRKFERDKDELRALGIPLETVTYSINYGMEEAQGYRISKKNLYLPYLRLLREGTRPPPQPDASRGPAVLAEADLFQLTPDGSIEIPGEAAADMVWGLDELSDLPGFPLAPAARSAFRKLTFDLDPQMGLRREGRKKPIVFAVPPETARAEEHLDALSDALLRRKRVSFTYHGIQRDQKTEREVRPYGLLFKHSHWYLVGWDENRTAERIFRVDRMEKVQVNPSSPATPDYDMPAEPVLERYRKREAWELGEADDTVQVLVRFRFPASLWAARNHHGVAVEQGGDGSTLRQFEVRQPAAFVRWILSQEGDATIESPPALQDAVRTMARQVADLYREDADA